MIPPSKAAADPRTLQPEIEFTGLLPDYKLLRRIGGGSYGVVLLAQNVFGELRAVKVIARSRFSDSGRANGAFHLGVRCPSEPLYGIYAEHRAGRGVQSAG